MTLRSAAAEGRDGRVVLGGRGSDAGARERRIDVDGGGLCAVRGLEVGARDEVVEVRLPVGFELLLPARLADDDAASDLLRVDEELDVARIARRVAEGRLVGTDDEVAGLLELG